MKQTYIIGFDKIPDSIEELNQVLFPNLHTIEPVLQEPISTREICEFVYKQIVGQESFILTRQEFDKNIKNTWLLGVKDYYQIGEKNMGVRQFRKNHIERLTNIANKLWEKFKNCNCFKISFTFTCEDWFSQSLIVDMINFDVFRNIPNIISVKDCEDGI